MMVGDGQLSVVMDLFADQKDVEFDVTLGSPNVRVNLVVCILGLMSMCNTDFCLKASIGVRRVVPLSVTSDGYDEAVIIGWLGFL